MNVMQADLPVFLSDRDPIAVLEKRADIVVSAMRKWGVGHLDTRETVHFCGLIHDPKIGNYVFLPRAAKTGKPLQDIETASLTMRALAKFAAETSQRDFEDQGGSGNSGLLSVIKRIADDFRDNGLFYERGRIDTRNAGKPDWSRTFKQETSIKNDKGTPVFTNLRTSRPVKTNNALLAQIQAAVLREIFYSHSWWLTGNFSSKSQIISCLRPPFPRTTWTKKLDSLLPSLYSTRAIKLTKQLQSYLRETRASDVGSFVFGVSDFHTVWESILREIVIRSPEDTRRNWNSVLPKPIYNYKNSNEMEARRRGMQTDIILKSSLGYTIVDAKYYSATSAKTAPSWPDIAKQMFYEHALKATLEDEGCISPKIRNVFAFPATCYQGPLLNVEMRHHTGKGVGSTFPTIECVYVSMRDALNYYVKGTKSISI